MPDSYHPNLRCKCSICGKCCTYLVPPTKADVSKIKKAGFKESDFIEVISNKKLIKTRFGMCYFLRVDSKGKNFCLIYDYRPKACIVYPSKDTTITRCPQFEKGFLLKNNIA